MIAKKLRLNLTNLIHIAIQKVSASAYSAKKMLGKLCARQLQWCFVSREIPFRDSEEDTLLFSRDIRDFDLVQKTSEIRACLRSTRNFHTPKSVL